MKKITLAYILMFIGIGLSYSQSSFNSSNDTKESQSNTHPILPETTKIIYNHHTNSGTAIYTTITLCEDYLIWEYDEARNNCKLRDSCIYNKEEFAALVKRLSTIEFSARYNFLEKYGGEGYSYSFESNSKEYLYYDDSSFLSGNYSQASSLIQNFIEVHKTNCEMLFRKLSMEPHESGHFGVFKSLPNELEKYRVKKHRVN